MLTLKLAELPIASTPYSGTEYLLGIQAGKSVRLPYAAGGSGTGAKVTISDTPPTSPTPSAGDLWWKSSTGILFVYYQFQWIQATPSGEGQYLGLGGGTLTGLDSSAAVTTTTDSILTISGVGHSTNFRFTGSGTNSISGSTFTNQLIFNGGNASEIYTQNGPLVLGTNSAERLRIGIDNIVTKPGVTLASPTSRFTLTTSSKADFHITAPVFGTSPTNTLQYGLTFSPGGLANTQAGIIISENGADGTAIGLYTTNSYASGPQLRANVLPNGDLIANVNIRSPIYYDLNNAAYYTLPSGNSSMNMIKTNTMGLNNITYVTRAGHNSIAILANGRLYTTSGTNSNNNVTTGRHAAGNQSSLGLDGFKIVEFPNEIAGTIIKIGGFCHSFAYALFANGNLYTWGNNQSGGPLGLGHNTVTYHPTLSATNVTDVYSHPSNNDYSVEDGRLFIKKSDGYIYGAGYNGYGALGDGTVVNKNAWTQITSLGTNVIKVWNMGASYGCTFFEKSDGTLWAAGYNGYGQLGVNSVTAAISTPTNVTAAWGYGVGITIKNLTGGYGYFDAAASAAGFNAMLLSNGTLKTCGGNGWGSLGTGNTTQQQVPVTPINITGTIIDIANSGGGVGAMYALTSDGNAWGWGRNLEGQMGNGNTTDAQPPAIRMSGVSKLMSDCMSSAHVYSYHSIVILKKTDGTYWCTGNNTFNHCATGQQNTANPITSFQKMPIPSDFEVYSFGSTATQSGSVDYFACYAVSTDGRILGWGYNGQYCVINQPNVHNVVYHPVMAILPIWG